MLKLTYSVADQNFETTKSLGILNLSLELLRALASSGAFKALTALANSTLRARLPRNGASVIECDHAIQGKLARIYWDQWKVYTTAQSTGNDWLFLPKGFASFARRPPCRLAAYVHDTMHLHYAANYPGKMGHFESRYFEQALQATLKQAEVIFTNSAFTQQQLCLAARSWGIRTKKIVVAGIGFTAPEAPLPAKKDQVVFLASRWPHKLTSMAIEFASRWQQESAYKGELLWVGAAGQMTFPAFGNWKQYPRLSAGEFLRLQSESRALVFFSDYEGFGMPPVEAAISGVCPVFSDIAATREVMNGAGIPFANGDFRSFSSAINQALAIEPTVLEIWKQKLLALHDWSKVVGIIVRELEA